MMVLSGLLKTPKRISPRRHSQAASQRSASTHNAEPNPPEPSISKSIGDGLIIREGSDLQPIESEDPDLRDLNNSLAALAAIFPDVQIEVFREMLSSFDEESRLALVTETLLKHKMKWVRGRYKVAANLGPVKAEKEPLQPDVSGLAPVVNEERFRSAEYQKSVKTMAYQEFKGLPRSTINAVLAEHNHSYTLARPTLVTLSAKSWRYSISSLFLRRKTVTSLEAEDHPLVSWQSTGQGAIAPTIRATGCPELDRELFDTLLAPILHRARTEQISKDHALALELNNAEAEQNDGLHDCECCFTSTTFEDLSACDGGGHFICFQCVRHAVNEAVFGQGWQRNIDLDAGTLRCVAAMSDDCQGCVPQALVRRAFDDEKDGETVLRKLDERLAEDNLLKTNLPLIRCPFCSYAEVDELYLPEAQRSWRLKRLGPSALYTFIILILSVCMIPLVLPIFVTISFLFLLLSTHQTFSTYLTTRFRSSLSRLRRKRLGLKFRCQSPSCARTSCISCSKAWSDIHICHESSLLALRTQIELAMSLAIKRTCPRCNTSFVKSSGCNKLTCVCGYQMCYVCRKDIGNGEGYRHFCEHFRPNGGRGCSECSKCDLYRCEDDEVVLRKAKEDAERRWVEKEGGGSDSGSGSSAGSKRGGDERREGGNGRGGDEKIRKVLEEKWKLDGERRGAWWQSEGDGKWWWCKGGTWEAPRWEEVFDAVVEAIVE